MNICITTSSFPVNATDVTGYFVLELARSLVQRGHRVFVLCPQVMDYACADVIDGVRIVRFRYMPLRSAQSLIGIKPGINAVRSFSQLVKVPLFLAGQLIALYRLVKREHIAVINSHWLIPQGVTAALVARVCGIKHIATLHSTDVYLASRLPMGKAISRFVDRNSRQCFIVSHFVRDRYRQIAGSAARAEVLPMGVDTDIFRKADKADISRSDRLTILFVGRLYPIKGVNFLVEALAMLRENHYDAELIIVGDGEQRQTLESQAASSGLAGHVRFVGSVSNRQLPAYYQQATMVVVPSIVLASGETEGMPVVILEAMACGVPVVASDVGGVSDLISDGDNGVLVEPANPRQLARAMERIASNRERMSENAYSTGQKYSWKNISQAYLDAMAS